MNNHTEAKILIAPLVYLKCDLPKAVRLSKTTIDSMRNKGEFPQPQRLGGRKVGWPVEVIQKWLSERPVVTGDE